MDNFLLYKDIFVGNNVHSNLKRIASTQGYTWTEVVTLVNIVNKMLVITTTFDEIKDEVRKGKFLFIDETNRTVMNNFIDGKYEPSVIILLALISVDMKYTGILQWHTSHHIIMAKHKKPIFYSNSKHRG